MTKEKVSILVADSKPVILNSIKKTLGSHKDINYSVKGVRSSEDALEKVSRDDFDVLLMNQNLPDRSGISILQELLKKKLGVPVIMIVAEGDEKLGVKAMDKGAYDFLTKQEIETVALNRAIRRVIQRKRLEDDIRESLEKMEKLAIRDGLTGLYNRRHFREALKNEYKKAKRHLQPLSCIMIDLDYFKSVNDNYGHQFGDFVLGQSARILRKQVRDTDFAARYGGEEFIVILPNTNLNGAYILAERIRSAFTDHIFRKGKISQTVTVSIGVSSTSDENVAGDEDLIANADKALYTAKNKGRNLVCTYDNGHVEEITGIKEETKNVADFDKRLKEFNENTKRRCIESAHSILREIEGSLDFINEHSVRVSQYIEKLIKQMPMSNEDAQVLKRAALLHDIGMIGISSDILKKKSKLTRSEYDIIKKHSNIGVKLIEKTRLFDKELPIILYHHERFDGKGYPDKLKGDNIPFGARILAVAEAFEVMMSGRYGRRTITSDDALAELRECSGSQFDPQVVKAFINLFDK